MGVKPVADARQCIGMMNSGRLCAVTNDRSRMMSPAPARRTLMTKLTAKFTDLGVTKQTVAKSLAEEAINICLPNLHPGSCGGMSLRERMDEEAMHLLDILADEPDNENVRGALQTACYFIAIVENPYKTDVELAKRMLVKKWQSEQEEDDAGD